MSTFGLIARRIIEEADLVQYGITPDYVVTAWIQSRYRQIIDELAFAEINKTIDYPFVTTAKVNGSVGAVVQGSATFVGTAFVAGMVGRYVRIGNDNEWYRISAFVSSTQLTLDTVYANISQPVVGYVIAQRFYNISPTIRWLFDIKIPRRAFSLIELAVSKLDELYPNRPFQPGIPQYWSPVGWDESTGERIVEIYPMADTTYRLEATGYSGITEPALNTSPHRDINDRILVEGGLADGFRFRAGKVASEVDTTDVRAIVARGRAYLEIAMSHEKQYDTLLSSMRKRDVLDAPQPRVQLMIQRRSNYGLVDPIMTAQDEVWSRSPAIGS